MDLVRAVSTLRDAAGMTNQELIDRSGMSASYYYARLRGAAPFDTNDIENLAHALGTHPHEISRVGGVDRRRRRDRTQGAHRTPRAWVVGSPRSLGHHESMAQRSTSTG